MEPFIYDCYENVRKYGAAVGIFSNITVDSKRVELSHNFLPIKSMNYCIFYEEIASGASESEIVE